MVTFASKHLVLCSSKYLVACQRLVVDSDNRNAHCIRDRLRCAVYLLSARACKERLSNIRCPLERDSPIDGNYHLDRLRKFGNGCCFGTSDWSTECGAHGYMTGRMNCLYDVGAFAKTMDVLRMYNVKLEMVH